MTLKKKRKLAWVKARRKRRALEAKAKIKLAKDREFNKKQATQRRQGKWIPKP